VLFKEFGFTAEKVAEKVREVYNDNTARSSNR